MFLLLIPDLPFFVAGPHIERKVNNLHRLDSYLCFNMVYITLQLIVSFLCSLILCIAL